MSGVRAASSWAFVRALRDQIHPAGDGQLPRNRGFGSAACFPGNEPQCIAQHQAFLRGEKARVEAWDERRQLMAEREAQRRAATSYEVIRQRVAAAPKPAVDTLQRQRLERSLKATPAMTEPMTTTPATKSHSRRARGECGVKLGKRLTVYWRKSASTKRRVNRPAAPLLPCWRNQSLPRWIHQLLQRGRCRNGRPWNLLALGAVLASLIKGPPGT